LKRVVVLILGFLGVVVLALVAWFGINAVDESLTPEATALLAPAQLPAPNEKNGYVDLLAIGAPADANTYAVGLKMLEAYRAQEEPGFKWTDEWKATIKPATPVVDKQVNACAPSAKLSCLEAVAAKPELVKVVAAHEAVLGRYRAIREKPEHVELVVLRRDFNAWAPQGRNSLHLLSRVATTASVQSGDMEAAVRELEQENAFLRKAAAGAATMAQKQVSLAYLQANALFVSELASRRPEAAAYLPRLQALMRPLSAEEAAMGAVLQNEWAFNAHQLGNDVFVAYVLTLDNGWPRFLARRLYRERETMNLYAAQVALGRNVAQVPATQYREAMAKAKSAVEALVPQSYPGMLVNPTGKLILTEMAGSLSLDYVGRMHDTQALLALVSTQLALRAAGASTPEAVTAALAGPVGQAHLNPYTGKPMAYEASTGRLSFDTQGNMTPAISALKKKYGKVAVSL
jgi:hypothetical protein